MNAKYWIVMGLVAVMALPAIAQLPAPKEKKISNVEKVARGSNDFAMHLYARLANQEGNLFFSPNSIHTALTMTYAGARGRTEFQMREVLQLFPPHLTQQMHPAYAKLIKQLNTKGKKSRYQLSVANRLWGQKGYPWRKEFLDLTRTNYGAGLREVDFVKATEAARKTINIWVEKQTQQKIKDLLQKGDVNKATVLVLTNAIYFKGDWASKFKKEQTKDTRFSVPIKIVKGHTFMRPRVYKTVSVPMMNQKGKFGYMETGDFQALELPYAGEELSMVIFLPRRLAQMDGLKDFEKLLTSKNLSKWLPKLRKREVIVSIPKFKMTCRFKLNEVLKSMGMADAFSPAADFSGMATMEKIWISDVIHKAFVDVNEEGTEAAAATAVIMGKGISRPSVFRADHPFVFMIRHRATGSILFMGRVVNPKAGLPSDRNTEKPLKKMNRK